MATTLERGLAQTSTSRGIPPARISAAGFAIASTWFALIETGVTQTSAPDVANAPLVEALETQYAWFATTLPQERIVTGIAIVAFAALVVSVCTIRERLGSGRASTAGALLVSLGSMVWIVGNVLQLGGHRAVGLMATHDNPIETAAAIAFTVDMIDDAFELVAFVTLGVGMLCFAVATWRVSGASRAWSRFTAAFAGALVALGFAHGMDNGDTTNLLLLAVGVLLTPAWLLWSDRLGPQVPPAARPSPTV